MRFGKWRGVAVAAALAFVFATGMARPAHALGHGHSIPSEVEAIDVNTGGPYFAPPIPYGHYAKDGCLGGVHGAIGAVKGSLLGLLHGGCGFCGGAGCNRCGGGLLGHGGGANCGGGPNCGGGLCGQGLLGHGLGQGCGGGLLQRNPCAACGGNGNGCGFCEGRGMLQGAGCRMGLGRGGCGGGHGLGQGIGGGCVGTASTIVASGQGIPAPSPQVVVTPSAQGACSQAGCHLARRHFHRIGQGCNACGGIGNGCGICGGGGSGRGLLSGRLCGGCGGGGCGACGGGGLLGGLGHGGGGGNMCGACGGRGCGACGGRGLLGGGLCGLCGGRGCKACLGGGKLKSILGLPSALYGKLTHAGEIEYFVGPGGPVPITPGYVPYVVTTRSPRDFLAFPPFSPVP